MYQPLHEEKLLNLATDISEREQKELRRLLLLLRTASQEEIVDAAFMEGGLTNRNFKVTLSNGKQIAVRIAGNGTADYLNRPAEKLNATRMAGLGIAPEIYYYDVRSGSQLVEFLQGRTLGPEDFQQEDKLLDEAAAIMAKYHGSGLEFAGAFDPFHEIQNYLRILRGGNFKRRYEGMDAVSEALLEVKVAYAEHPPKPVPCHNDPLPANFIYDDAADRLYLIDWEYAGMNDAYFDLAALIVENGLNQEREVRFLTAYFGGEIPEEGKARVLVNKLLVDTLWCVWSLVQIYSGKDADFYWQYGQERADRCKAYIQNAAFGHYIEILKKPV